ncbi:MAG: hypothetical protein ABEJ77_01340 [Halanaeroarchaeum sp.]
MADLRTLLAAVLGVVLGVVFLVFPEAIVRVHLAGRLPRDRGGSYGSAPPVRDRWRRVVQAVGLAALLLGASLGAGIVLGG